MIQLRLVILLLCSGLVGCIIAPSREEILSDIIAPGSLDAGIQQDSGLATFGASQAGLRSIGDGPCTNAQLSAINAAEATLLMRLPIVMAYLQTVRAEQANATSPNSGTSVQWPFRNSFGEITEEKLLEVTGAFGLIASRIEQGDLKYYCLSDEFEFVGGKRCKADGIVGHTFQEVEFVDLCPLAFANNAPAAAPQLGNTIVHELSHQNRNSIYGKGTRDGVPRLSPDYAYAYERLLDQR